MGVASSHEGFGRLLREPSRGAVVDARPGNVLSKPWRALGTNRGRVRTIQDGAKTFLGKMVEGPARGGGYVGSWTRHEHVCACVAPSEITYYVCRTH